MNNGRIRHATETFVNNLIAGVKKLIESNSKQINVLYDRGYATPKIINSGNIDNLPSGKYIVQLDNPGWGYLDVNWLSADEWEQKFTSMDKNNPTVKVRVKQSGVIGDWIPLATTTKTDISSSDLRNLWKIDRTPTVYKIGGKIFLSGIIREGITTNDTVMMVLPEGFRPKETTYKNVIVDNLIYQIYILQNGDVVINNHNMPSNSIVRFDLSFE